MDIDKGRSVRAVRDRVEGGMGGQDIAQPGEMTPYSELADDVVVHKGYHLSCPGCAQQIFIPTAGPDRRWHESGDLDKGTLSLREDFTHQQGCGWQGRLTDGVFTPI